MKHPNKAVLSARSKYFERMFDSSMKENLSNEVEVPDVTPVVFEALLKFLYSGLEPKNLNEIFLELLVVADKYRLEALVKVCETSAFKNLNADNVVDTLLVATTMNNERLLARAKSIFRGCSESVKKSEEALVKLKAHPDLILDLLWHAYSNA